MSVDAWVPTGDYVSLWTAAKFNDGTGNSWTVPPDYDVFDVDTVVHS